jgi:hypothetical protein
MDPRDLRNQLVPEVKERILSVAVGYPIAKLGDTIEELSEYLQGLAIACLLADEDQDEFRDNLVRSGHARRYFLKRSADEQHTTGRHLAVSRTDALFDCLAAGSLSLAKEIVDLSVDEWHGDWEYEDEYWYRKFVGALLSERWAKKAGRTSAEDALRRLAAAIGDDAAPRHQVCNALLGRDQVVFNEALFNLLEAARAQFDEKRASIVSAELPTALFWLKSFVSIEGLALVRLAQLSGMSADEYLPLCPEAARLAVATRDTPDLFVDVDIERRQLRGQR